MIVAFLLTIQHIYF